MLGNRIGLLRPNAVIVLMISLFVSGCTSPEQEEKHRQNLMQALISSAVKHMHDRNPQTIQESMTVLVHDEMTEDLVEKLQNQKLLPETDLSILKIVDDAQKAHTSNKVVLDAVKPIDPVEKDNVRFNVLGKDIAQQNGQDAGDKTFDYIVTCKLTKEMDGYPKITDLVMEGEKSPAKSAPEADGKPAEHHRKRHRK